jgi:hypothetical protein
MERETDHGDQTSGRSDDVAKAAVRALAEGRVGTRKDAVERAIHETGADPRARRPTLAELRAHARLHEESTQGEQGRRARIEAATEELLEVLAVLERAVLVHDPEGSARPQPAAYGRAALAQFDLDPTTHVRVTTSASAAVLAQALFEAGFSDPTCGSKATRYGRIDEIAFEGAEAMHRVLRIPPGMAVDPARDVIHGRPIEHATFDQLAARRADARRTETRKE